MAPRPGLAEGLGTMPLFHRFSVPQGTLDVSRWSLSGPAHGYRIAQRLLTVVARCGPADPGGTVSSTSPPRAEGSLKSEYLRSETGLKAKFYSLTRKGEKQLAVEKHSWDRLSAIQLIFDEGG